MPWSQALDHALPLSQECCVGGPTLILGRDLF